MDAQHVLHASNDTAHGLNHSTPTNASIAEITPTPLPTQTMGAAAADGLTGLISVVVPAVNTSYFQDSLRFLFLGTILETGRRFWQWVMDRFTSGFVLTAIFDEGDPVYEWLTSWLNQQKVWNNSREFRVTARSSGRTWGVNSGDSTDGHAEYLPAYDSAQIFRYKGVWVQVKRVKSSIGQSGHEDGGSLVLTLYTRLKTVLDDLVEESRSLYMKESKPRITVHGTDHCGSWCQTTTKARRPMDSLILPTGMKEQLLNDARDFLRSEEWYREAGIQHKRGYLLYGLPGTGKSSTIHALAGELDLEIYSLSLAVNGLDDNILSRLISNTPAHSIILLEDIDCAFPSREEQEKEEEDRKKGVIIQDSKSRVTLSGLLNVLDGVASEEGRLLFATTNHVNRLDHALLRPGRMDVKLHYKMTTRDQIYNLFKRFYPAEKPKVASLEEKENEKEPASKEAKAADLPTPPGTPRSSKRNSTQSQAETVSEDSENNFSPIRPPRLPRDVVESLAERFADAVPEDTYTVAELQGYLLTVKTRPFDAVDNVKEWMKEMGEEKLRLKEAEHETQERERRLKEAASSTPEPSIPYPASSPSLSPAPLPVEEKSAEPEKSSEETKKSEDEEKTVKSEEPPAAEKSPVDEPSTDKEAEGLATPPITPAESTTVSR